MLREDRGQRSVRLSICMPTYNFGKFIGPVLQSITDQIVEEIEIVIYDGGSTDNTAQVVQQFQRRFPCIRYHRAEVRGGIDRDMARTVELARGEYCWLFSSDDVMKDGALAKVLRQTDLGLDLYLCGLTLCTFQMDPLRDHQILNLSSDAVFDLGNPEERATYFSLAQTTTAFFSFMGSLIFRKSRWDAIPFDERFDGSLWAHVARIFRMIPDGLRLKYLAKSHLYKRGDNDSFMDKGIVHRYRLAIEGYHRLADTFFSGTSVEAFHIKRVVRNEFLPQHFLKAKLYIKEKGEQRDIKLLDHLAAKVYSDPLLLNWIYLIIYKVMPLYPYKIARSSYRRAKSLLLNWKA